jgi:hypothetical protein
MPSNRSALPKTSLRNTSRVLLLPASQSLYLTVADALETISALDLPAWEAANTWLGNKRVVNKTRTKVRENIFLTGHLSHWDSTL